MKALICGDLHLKSSTILPIVDEKIKKYDVNRIIFTGDYVDDWGADEDKYYKELNMLCDWVVDKKDLGYEVTMLCGNHDFSYLSPKPMCSGHMFGPIESYIRYRLIDVLKVQYAAGLPNYLITHAGLTAGGANYLEIKEINKPSNKYEVISIQLNDMFDKALISIVNRDLDGKSFDLITALQACGRDRGGIDPYPSPLGCDLKELGGDPFFGLNQIVGHTPMKTCQQLNNPHCRIGFCDTHSTYRNNTNIGDNSMLLGENNKVKVV